MSVAKDLLLATNNSKKLKEIRALLGNDFHGQILCAADFSQFPEPEETGTTFEENARLKADYYAQRTGLVTLADDSGLMVDALDGRPGVFSARYAPSDDERIEKLLGELRNVPGPQRSARFVCALCVALPGGSHLVEFGTLEGFIELAPRGANGFGYDPIFLVEESATTLAEMDENAKNEISHRAVAMKKLRSGLIESLK